MERSTLDWVHIHGMPWKVHSGGVVHLEAKSGWTSCVRKRADETREDFVRRLNEFTTEGDVPDKYVKKYAEYLAKQPRLAEQAAGAEREGDAEVAELTAAASGAGAASSGPLAC